LLTSQQQLADALGVSRRRLSYWKERGCPIPSCGPYDPKSIERWARDKLQRSKFTTSEPLEELKREALAAEVRCLEASADIEETKTAKMRGELIDRKEAERITRDIFARVERTIKTIPRMVAPSIASASSPAEVEDILSEAITVTLAHLSRRESIDA